MSAKKKIPKLSEGDAKKLISDYMREQNRPYNSKMVFENLHGAIGQTQVQKTMDDLADAGVLVRKDNKKQKIYWTSQDTPEMLESMKLLQRWRDIEMLNGSSDPTSDNGRA